MRSEQDVTRFQENVAASCSNENVCAYYVSCYEACIPRTFYDVAGSQVSHNVEMFNRFVLKYCQRWKKALRNGYSVLLMGDNGVGKTMFLSFMLTQMLKRGCTAYYTTLAQLDIDIKRGFRDSACECRLEQLLGSDFVAIDELGKEHFRTDSYLNTRMELLLKQRYDDGEPVLLATNLDYESLGKMYGPSVMSMLDGKYTSVFLETGDFRKAVTTRMRKDMGY